MSEDTSQTIQPPNSPQQIRDFIGQNACSMKFKNAPQDIDDFNGYLNCEASENDIYTVSAHDLLSAFQDWFEST